MDQNSNAMQMLDLMVQPSFCVRDDRILRANPAAQALLLREGMELSPMLATGQEEYAAFSSGCLYLTLQFFGQTWAASVTRMGDTDIFLLEEDRDRSELQAMALAARELRGPLANVMTTAGRMFPAEALDDDPKLQEQVSRLNRGLYQMLRIIGNMTDAQQYTTIPQTSLEMVNITAFFREIFQGAIARTATTGITLEFSNLHQDLFTLADREKLERAVLNIVSNALKFTPPGGTIQAKLSRKGRMLHLTVQDNGTGIPDGIRGQLHHRYLRQPGIEDGRFGIGLGMVLIRSAAAIHGGAVLIDQPEDCSTRIIMTMAIRQDPSGGLRSPIVRMDYAGELDHTLVELSESLPASLYEPQ